MTEPVETAPLPSFSTYTVALEYPIQREGGAITTLTLRKPKAGELRGLNIQSIMAGDVASVITLLPRISTPIITAHEASQLEAEDIAEVAGSISLFFMSKAQKTIVDEALGRQTSKA